MTRDEKLQAIVHEMDQHLERKIQANTVTVHSWRTALAALSQPEEPRACDSCGPFASVPMCSKCGRLSLGREDLKALDAAAPQPEEEPESLKALQNSAAISADVHTESIVGQHLARIVAQAFEAGRAAEAKRGSGGGHG